MEIVEALASLSWFPGTSEKRFVRDMHSAVSIARARGVTDAQARYLKLLAWKRRRGMPARLVEQPDTTDG